MKKRLSGLVDKYFYNRSLAHKNDKKEKASTTKGLYVTAENELTGKEFDQRDETETKVDYLLNAARIQDDSYPGEGYYLAPEKGKPVVLAFHANAELASRQFLSMYQFCKEKGYGLFCPEYASYEKGSTTPANEQNFYKDGRNALQFLEGNGITNNQIIVYGESLGTSVAMNVAHENKDQEVPLAGLVLNCPFTNKRKAAEDFISSYAGKPLGKLISRIVPKQLNTEEKAKDITIPTVILSATQDKMVPQARHAEVYDALLGDDETVTLNNDLGRYSKDKRKYLMNFAEDHIVTIKSDPYIPALFGNIENLAKSVEKNTEKEKGKGKAPTSPTKQHLLDSSEGTPSFLDEDAKELKKMPDLLKFKKQEPEQKTSKALQGLILEAVNAEITQAKIDFPTRVKTSIENNELKIELIRGDLTGGAVKLSNLFNVDFTESRKGQRSTTLSTSVSNIRETTTQHLEHCIEAAKDEATLKAIAKTLSYPSVKDYLGKAAVRSLGKLITMHEKALNSEESSIEIDGTEKPNKAGKVEETLTQTQSVEAKLAQVNQLLEEASTLHQQTFSGLPSSEQRSGMNGLVDELDDILASSTPQNKTTDTTRATVSRIDHQEVRALLDKVGELLGEPEKTSDTAQKSHSERAKNKPNSSAIKL